jgi:hypothetical protein
VTYASPQAAIEDGVAYINNSRALRFQGNKRVPRQAYLDLAIRPRLAVGKTVRRPSATEVRLGIQSVMDTRPPLIANDYEVPYSTYGTRVEGASNWRSRLSFNLLRWAGLVSALPGGPLMVTMLVERREAWY